MNSNTSTARSASAFLADLVRDIEPLSPDGAAANASHATSVPASCELERTACVFCVQLAHRRRLGLERGRMGELGEGRGAQASAITETERETNDLVHVEDFAGDEDFADNEEDTESDAEGLEVDWDDVSRPVSCTLVPPPLDPPASSMPDTLAQDKLSLPRAHTAFDAFVLSAVLTSTSTTASSASDAAAPARRLRLEYRVDLSSALAVLLDLERSQCLRQNAAAGKVHLVLQLIPFTCCASPTEPEHCEVQCSSAYTRILYEYIHTHPYNQQLSMTHYVCEYNCLVNVNKPE